MTRDAILFTVGVMVGLVCGLGVALADDIGIGTIIGSSTGPSSLSIIPSEYNCPPERPIKRTVVGMTMSCTLLACVGRLVCPSNPPGSYPPLLGADCYYAPAVNCNTCSSNVTELCLSQEELDRAK